MVLGLGHCSSCSTMPALRFIPRDEKIRFHAPKPQPLTYKSLHDPKYAV